MEQESRMRLIGADWLLDVVENIIDWDMREVTE